MIKINNKIYYDKFSLLIELERKEEMQRHIREIENISGKEREKRGRALIKMNGRKKGKLFGNYVIVRYVKASNDILCENEFQKGDVIMVSTKNPLNSNNPMGTVYKKSEKYIDIAFSEPLAKNTKGKNLRLDLYVNDLTYKRMQEALQTLMGDEEYLTDWQKILFSKKKPSFTDEEADFFFNRTLNNSQKDAVNFALQTDKVSLIQGPPGTGKTITAVEIIRQYVKRGKRVLATADSNGAVDNLLNKISKHNKKILRIGNPLRINDELKIYSLDFQMEIHPLNEEKKNIYKEIDFLLKEQSKLKKPNQRYLRGLTGEEVLELSKENKTVRGIPLEKILEMKPWFEMQHKINPKFNKIEEIEQKIIEDLLKKADIICSTNVSAASEVLENRKFDILVVDEATQSTEPSVLIPLVKADKAILIGDEKQLPPTVLSKEAEEIGLSLSLFERLLGIYGEDLKKILNIQYRMHKDIMRFSSKQFYRGKIIADESVKNKILKIDGFSDKSIHFYDLNKNEIKEAIFKESKSYYNEEEIYYISYLVGECLRNNILSEQIGVITPYKAQKVLLKKQLDRMKVEIDTIDSYQGREKDIIMLSLVRSNFDKNIGFLNDLRRLNVAITRAKRKLIIVGDAITLSNHPVYYDLIEYIKSNGFYKKIPLEFVKKGEKNA